MSLVVSASGWSCIIWKLYLGLFGLLQVVACATSDSGTMTQSHEPWAIHGFLQLKYRSVSSIVSKDESKHHLFEMFETASYLHKAGHPKIPGGNVELSSRGMPSNWQQVDVLEVGSYRFSWSSNTDVTWALLDRKSGICWKMLHFVALSFRRLFLLFLLCNWGWECWNLKTQLTFFKANSGTTSIFKAFEAFELRTASATDMIQRWSWFGPVEGGKDESLWSHSHNVCLTTSIKQRVFWEAWESCKRIQTSCPKGARFQTTLLWCWANVQDWLSTRWTWDWTGGAKMDGSCFRPRWDEALLV